MRPRGASIKKALRDPDYPLIKQAGQRPARRPSVPAVSRIAKSAVTASESLVPFEEAIQKLESIVETMESGELTLEQLLTRFEEGARLAKSCQLQLEAAEVRVQQLEKSLTGDLETRPVELSGEATGS